MAIEFLHAVPLLRIFDVAKAREFYVGWLGFTIDWEHRFDARAPLYMQVSRAGLVLHLTEHHGDCCPTSHSQNAFGTLRRRCRARRAAPSQQGAPARAARDPR